MSTFGMRDEYCVPGEQIEHFCSACGMKIVPVLDSDRAGIWRHEDYTLSYCEEGDDLESPTFRVEFLRAWDDGTWNTEIYEVHPRLSHEKATNDNLIEWANRVLGTQAQYRKVVLWAVYSLEP
ncbi:hypothetical protein C4565_08340 [Candidatus Parcubacteria bacterium]|nr:MAG: hypothetical protein C4565_08340 [Candidatus Parcubacteria bacterium]